MPNLVAVDPESSGHNSVPGVRVALSLGNVTATVNWGLEKPKTAAEVALPLSDSRWAVVLVVVLLVKTVGMKSKSFVDAHVVDIDNDGVADIGLNRRRRPRIGVDQDPHLRSARDDSPLDLPINHDRSGPSTGHNMAKGSKEEKIRRWRHR